MSMSRGLRRIPGPLAVAALIWVPAQTSAYELYSSPEGGSVALNLEIGAAAFSSQDDYSGQGREEVNWTEAYGRIGLSGEAPMGSGAALYGALSGLGTTTDGDGDAGGFTAGDESEFDLEDAYVGWRSEILDISVGSQAFVVGDGWLINGDALSVGEGLGEDLDRGGAYWLAPRRAFRKTAIARIDVASPLRGDVFYLGSDTDIQGDTELAGVNVEYVDETRGALGAYYLRVLDVDQDVLGGFQAHRDGLNTFSVRGQGSLGVENLFLSFEGTLQRGSPDINGRSMDVEAHAWYLEGGYQFSGLPLAPQLTYRFSTFSGDDPDTDELEAFDPLFFGFNRGYGTWFQGEVAANYAGPFNSNADVHHVGLYLHPTESIRLGALYFDFTTRETAPGVSDDYASELDLFMEWPVTPNLFVSPVYAIFEPGDGLEQALGADETNHYFQVMAIWSF